MPTNKLLLISGGENFRNVLEPAICKIPNNFRLFAFPSDTNKFLTKIMKLFVRNRIGYKFIKSVTFVPIIFYKNIDVV